MDIIKYSAAVLQQNIAQTEHLHIITTFYSSCIRPVDIITSRQECLSAEFLMLNLVSYGEEGPHYGGHHQTICIISRKDFSSDQIKQFNLQI